MSLSRSDTFYRKLNLEDGLPHRPRELPGQIHFIANNLDIDLVVLLAVLNVWGGSQIHFIANSIPHVRFLLPPDRFRNVLT